MSANTIQNHDEFKSPLPAAFAAAAVSALLDATCAAALVRAVEVAAGARPAAGIAAVPESGAATARRAFAGRGTTCVPRATVGAAALRGEVVAADRTVAGVLVVAGLAETIVITAVPCAPESAFVPSVA